MQGYGKAEKDKVDLARATLRDQQGLIEFPPSGTAGPSQAPPKEDDDEGEGDGEGRMGSSSKRTRSAYCCLHVAINEATQLASVGATNVRAPPLPCHSSCLIALQAHP